MGGLSVCRHYRSTRQCSVSGAMSEDNSWRTTLPPSSATTSTETTVVRPDTLNIGATTISMDLLTPQLLQFLQNCQPAAASTTSTPDAKVLDGFIPQLTKSFAEATAGSSEITTTSGSSTAVQSSVIPQNSFIISSGPADSSNNQNYILISPIGTAAAAVSSSIAAPLVSSPTTAVVLPNTTAAAAAAAASRNLLLLNDTVTTKTNVTAGGEVKDVAEQQQQQHHHHQDAVSSSTSGVQESSSLLDSDTNRPTRPSSSDSSLFGGTQPMGRRRCSGLFSRPVTVGESLTTQLNRLEQKRARNRDAARRCRERKIHLIKTLEKKVSQLSETNRQLERELEQTQGEVKGLRQLVEQHIKPGMGGGCSLPLKG
uniref:Basic leucine zipper bZIP transcription factor n=1 Tax=Echinococcus granulosus TaxID=6210 RepID=A0A068WLL0_ECHGR|nr:Basic leucine zipper bZIP transcription factor [Echinococcus granulosus]